MYKRFIAILLFCAICAGLIVLPAAASSFNDSVYDSGMIYTDYKTAEYYEFYATSYSVAPVSYRNYDGSSHYFETINNLSITFVPDSLEYTSDYMMFCLYAPQRPKEGSVFVEFGDVNGVPYTAAFEGGLYEPNRQNYYFYRVTMPETATKIKISFNTNGTITGSYGIYSCFGYTSVIDSYLKADVNVYDRYRVTEGDEIKFGKSFNAADLPITYRNDTTTNLMGSSIVIRLDSDRFKTTAVENVSLFFTTYNETITATASLIGRDESIKDISDLKFNLKKDSNWGLLNDFEIGLGTAYQYAGYELDVDLSGYDMDKYELVVTLIVDSVSWDSDDDLNSIQCVDVTLRSITYVPSLVVDPWYKPITKAFDRLRNSVSDWFDSVWSTLANFRADCREFFSNFQSDWNSRWDSLFQSLEGMLGVSSGQQSEVESNVQQNTEKQEEVTDKSDELISDLEEIEEQEEEMLTVPEINQEDLALGTLIPQSGLTLMNNVMVTITNNEHVSQMIVLALSIAVVGVLIL